MGRKVTVMLDDDVAARLEEESKRAGTSLEQTVNDLVRRARTGEPVPFRVRAQSLGQPLVDLNCTARALDDQHDLETQ